MIVHVLVSVTGNQTYAVEIPDGDHEPHEYPDLVGRTASKWTMVESETETDETLSITTSGGAPLWDRYPIETSNETIG
jgi:hypothetical protein